MNDILGLIFICTGLFFDLVGGIGMVRLPDMYNRLQSATKCVTLGTCLILLGTFIMVGLTPSGMKALLCMIFILMTSPVAAHALSRGAHRSGVKLWEGSVADQYAADKEGEA